MKKSILFILMLTKFCFGQSIKLPTNVQSPTTASLGKYGDIPVNLYNGTTNVNLPIYTMTEKGINLDISLSYDASGVAVNSVPSWIGQNWSLNAGGVISRQINNYPDEYSTLNTNNSPKGVGYINPISRDRINVSNWNDSNVLFHIEQSNMGDFAETYPNIGKDSEPDIFTFNFMGHFGKFFMGEDGQWRVASEENFKVKILESDYIYPMGLTSDPYGNQFSKAIGKIQLIDDQGTTYTFAGTNNSIEYSKDFFLQDNNDFWKANAWYLTKVQNNQDITLFTLNYIRDSSYTASFYNYQNSTTFNASFNGSVFDSGCTYSYGSGISGAGSAAIGGNLISPVYLSSISSFSNESLIFNSTYSNATYYESVNIHDISNYISNIFNNNIPNPADQSNFLRDLIPYSSPIQAINKLKFRKLTSINGFNQGVTFVYNEPTATAPHDLRFNLNNVTINGGLYQFEYDRFNLLPRLMSKAVDHLGYYNGIEYPNVINPVNHFNQRISNSNNLLIGSLTKVIYPTKGFNQFEYEPHQYNQYVADDKQSLVQISNSIIGGLRVKKIISNDLNSNTSVKEYKYVKNYNLDINSNVSTGILSNLPKYYWPDWRVKSTNGSQNGYLSETHFSVNPIISMSNFFGSPIGYSEVVEINSDQSYSIFKYTSNEDYRDEPFVTTFNLSPSPYQKYNDKSMLRGKLNEISVYNSSSSLVSKKNIIYSTNDANLIKYVKGATLTNKACSGGVGNGFLMGNAYKIYYFDFNKSKEQEISYLNGEEINNEINYSFGYYPDLSTTLGDCFLRSKTFQTYLNSGQYDSKNTQEIYSYPFDIVSTTNNTLVSKRILGPLVKEIKKNGILISTDKLEYKYFNPYFTLPEKMLHAKGNNIFEEDIVIDNYDLSGNINQFHQNNGMYTTLSWCYGNKYPIVKIEGEKILDRSFIDNKTSEIQTLLNTTAPVQSNNLLPILAKLQEIRSSFPNHQVTTLTYYPQKGITSKTSPNGDIVYFIYDSSGKLQFVKDKSGNIVSENEYHYRP